MLPVVRFASQRMMDGKHTCNYSMCPGREAGVGAHSPQICPSLLSVESPDTHSPHFGPSFSVPAAQPDLIFVGRVEGNFCHLRVPVPHLPH